MVQSRWCNASEQFVQCRWGGVWWVQCGVMGAVQGGAVPCRVVRYSVMWCSVVRCSVVQCSAVCFGSVVGAVQSDGARCSVVGCNAE